MVVCHLIGASYLDKIELCLGMDFNDTFKFNITYAIKILEEHGNLDRNVGPLAEAVLITIYAALMTFGILANVIVSFVIARRAQMHTARNLFIVNLTVSDVTLCVICMPFSLVRYLRRKWKLGVALCKLVPFLQGTNIMVSIGTITVIALDRYFTIVRGQDGPTTKRRVIISIALVWLLSFSANMPVLFYQVLEPVKFENVLFYQTCVESWPNEELRILYAAAVLMVQAVIPAAVVGCIHAKIASYLNAHASTQKDSRRAQRELTRNKRTTMLLSGVAVLFTVSWLPLGLVSLIIDMMYPISPIEPTPSPAPSDQVSSETLIIICAVSHIIAMTTAISNPVVYGWLNSNIRRELLSLISNRFCRRVEEDENNRAPSPTLMTCQNGKRPATQQATTTYTAL